MDAEMPNRMRIHAQTYVFSRRVVGMDGISGDCGVGPNGIPHFSEGDLGCRGLGARGDLGCPSEKQV